MDCFCGGVVEWGGGIVMVRKIHSSLSFFGAEVMRGQMEGVWFFYNIK
jgi:hypothetical protein